MQLSNTTKNQRFVNNLKKKASNKRVEQELPEIPGAVKRFEKLENEVKKLKNLVAGLETIVRELKAEKFQRDMRGDNATTK